MAPAPSRIRSESIVPPDPPDEAMIEKLRETFHTLPRIAEAWVRGERLTPDDSSPPYDTTNIVLVLDPPLTEHPRDELASEIAALEKQLDVTGYRREPARGWVFAKKSDFRGSLQHPAAKIYSRPSASG
jgi:hypothetical protein